jgi:hypothetical protein
LPKTGWSMPEPAPDPDDNKLLDSAIIEQDYASLPGLYNIERDMPTDDPTPADSATSEPPTPADATPCNQMQHDSENTEDVAPGLRPCPVPLDVLRARLDHRKSLDLLELIKSIEQNRVTPADADARKEEILV